MITPDESKRIQVEHDRLRPKEATKTPAWVYLGAWAAIFGAVALFTSVPLAGSLAVAVALVWILFDGGRSLGGLETFRGLFLAATATAMFTVFALIIYSIIVA